MNKNPNCEISHTDKLCVLVIYACLSGDIDL